MSWHPTHSVAQVLRLSDREVIELLRKVGVGVALPDHGATVETMRHTCRDLLSDALSRKPTRKNIELGDELWKTKTVINALRYRQRALVQIVICLQQRSPDFWKDPDAPIHLVTKTKCAHETGVPISTVCRLAKTCAVVVAGRVVGLESFFGRMATVELKEWIEQTIAAEDKTRPLSDGELTLLWQEQHPQDEPIARETMCKWRRQTGIPTAKERTSRE